MNLIILCGAIAYLAGGGIACAITLLIISAICFILECVNFFLEN